ncbi:MAG: hypothetical protein RQ982_07125 [Gammaproteobacteria bacterium]|nr:hypothetical protein [Gammaproteobacteria bacterium]
MRWLFLIVLSLNLSYYAWTLSRTPSDDYADVPVLKNVETIVLLSELKPEKPAGSADKSPSANQEVAVIDDVKAMPVEEVSADSVTEKGSIEDNISAITGSDIKQVEADARPGDAVNTAEAVEASQAVKKLLESASASKVSDAAVKVPGEPSQLTSCYTLGPFRDLDELRGLTREIKSYVVKADFRGSEEKEQALYWVYIKPEKSRKKAIETGHRLKAEKIKDFYVIRKGEKINGLSLGHFRNREGAYELAAKVQKRGFDVTVEAIFKTYTVYWLDYQLIDGETVPEETFDRYIKTDEKGKISRLRRDCLT